MKKGIYVLGAEFVLDEFHIQKYIRRMARLADGSAEESREETETKLQEWIEKGNRKKLEEWTAQACAALKEKDGKKLKIYRSIAGKHKPPDFRKNPL